MVAGLAQAHAHQGNRDEARWELDRLAKPRGGATRCAIACSRKSMRRLGETDEALTRLMEAVTGGMQT